ncbi:hypothetical protein KC353_g61 [Hortaea werneckii]|nr:hypothetical protein KC353_g61 [Hortaea werneckii]
MYSNAICQISILIPNIFERVAPLCISLLQAWLVSRNHATRFVQPPVAARHAVAFFKIWAFHERTSESSSSSGLSCIISHNDICKRLKRSSRPLRIIPELLSIGLRSASSMLDLVFVKRSQRRLTSFLNSGPGASSIASETVTSSGGGVGDPSISCKGALSQGSLTYHFCRRYWYCQSCRFCSWRYWLHYDQTWRELAELRKSDRESEESARS